LTDMSNPRVNPVSIDVVIVDLVVLCVLIVYSCTQRSQLGPLYLFIHSALSK